MTDKQELAVWVMCQRTALYAVVVTVTTMAVIAVIDRWVNK